VRDGEGREGRSTFYRHPTRFGRDLWGLWTVGGQKRRRRRDSVEVGLGQPLGEGRRESTWSMAEGESGRGERESGIEIFVFVCHFSSLPRSVPPYYSYLEIPPAKDVLDLN
jgi:hypothetical protein